MVLCGWLCASFSFCDCLAHPLPPCDRKWGLSRTTAPGGDVWASSVIPGRLRLKA